MDDGEHDLAVQVGFSYRFAIRIGIEVEVVDGLRGQKLDCHLTSPRASSGNNALGALIVARKSG
jgi:hypothetical protein